ncbi:MAG: D-alanyl-D-alanine carboxypeptidase family protein [Bacillota bacterium]|jgi:D-alanyl-D-alanine carboxypeptidase (penicillin-binding protein 5/6)
MNRRLYLLGLLLCCLTVLWTFRPGPAVNYAQRLTWAPSDLLSAFSSADWLSARGAAVMDVGSLRLLAGKNSRERLPMASTTKIMTAILAIESGRLDEVVTVSADACRVEPSAIWLMPGERIKLEHLVYGLMLRSGNDAANAIAEFLGGSIHGFAVLMNQKADELGLQDTNFVNPHGLTAENHFTSAYDLAKLAAYALQNDKFSQVVATRSISLPWDGHAEPRVWYNKNRLLTSYPGADGVKTGWTRAAGNCLVASAERAGMRVVAVVLNSHDHYGETAWLMDHAFQNYSPHVLVTKGQWLQSLPVAKGHPRYIGVIAADGYYWPLAAGEAMDLQCELVLPPELTVPVQAGQRVGTLRVLRRGDCLAEIPLLADQTSDRGPWSQFLHQVSGRFWDLLELLMGGES